MNTQDNRRSRSSSSNRQRTGYTRAKKIAESNGYMVTKGRFVNWRTESSTRTNGYRWCVFPSHCNKDTANEDTLVQSSRNLTELCGWMERNPLGKGSAFKKDTRFSSSSSESTENADADDLSIDDLLSTGDDDERSEATTGSAAEIRRIALSAVREGLKTFVESEQKYNDKRAREIGERVAGMVIPKIAESVSEHVGRLEADLEAKVGEAIEKRTPRLVRIEVSDGKKNKKTGEEKIAHEKYEPLLEEIALGMNVFISGPAGSGKTFGALEAAKDLGRTAFVMMPVSDKFELLGYVDASGTYQKTTAYEYSTTKSAILIIDEIDRSYPKALTAINSLLANDFAVFPGVGRVDIDPTNQVICTANTWGVGVDAEYVGSSKLDAATTNRFQSRITWDYDPALESHLAISKHGGTTKTVELCQKIRSNLDASGIKIVWSPRDTFAFCRRVASGMDAKVALDRSALATLRPAQLTKAMADITLPR